ncbi:MAG: carbonic anhydrase [Bdellovibrionales bacterium]|nr:carbonic anhydrase [Bdellovibrionales bacterium]
MRTQTPETLAQLTPEKALEILMSGNQRFVNNLRHNRDLLEQVNKTSEGQYPFAIILSCIDSRTSAELTFDQGLGDIFSVRIAGNIINEDILGSMEFACKVTGSKLVLVLGHSECGAIKGACNHVEMGNLTGLLEKIQPSVEKVQAREKNLDSNLVAKENVLHSMHQITENSSILRMLYKEKKIGIVGAMYDISSGEVSIIEKWL